MACKVIRATDGKLKIEAPENKVWFTTGELSGLLSCSQRLLMGMRRRGTGPAHLDLGQDVKYHISAIETYLNNNERSVKK